MQDAINQLLTQIREKNVVFTDVLTLISEHYNFTETAFDNGAQKNAAGENSGSCRVFSFAQLNGLNKEDTLTLFAEHYADVLNTPEGNDHQNIRQFMQHGWDGIAFHGNALAPLSS